MKTLNLLFIASVLFIVATSVAFGVPKEDSAQLQKLIDEKLVKSLNLKDIDLYMSIWPDDLAIQMIHVNDKGQVQQIVGVKDIKNLMSSFMNEQNPNAFAYSHLNLQIDGDKASGRFKWTWGQWVDNLKMGKGNWATGLFIKQQGQWKLHDADFFSVGLKLIGSQDVESIQKNMDLLLQAYAKKDIAPLAQVAAVEHRYIDKHGRKEEGLQATQAALAKDFPTVELDMSKMTVYLYLRDGKAAVSQPRPQSSTPIQFKWQRQNGGWKLIETDFNETLAVESQGKLLTAWSKMKRL